MFPAYIEQILVGVNLLGLIFIAFLFFKQKVFLDNLFPSNNLSQKEGHLILKDQFNNLLESLDKVYKDQHLLKKQVLEYRKEGLGHLQRVETLRYNPYNDTGGDQSFSICLLDGSLNGVMLTSLHSRSGTRVYAKNIKNGKSDLELSKEESVLLNKATNGYN